MKEKPRSRGNGEITERGERLGVTKISPGQHHSPIQELQEEKNKGKRKQRNRRQMNNTGEEARRLRYPVNGGFPAQLRRSVQGNGESQTKPDNL